jgi:flavin reductase (DIM6/NTAB) family NADH-FMN oxidoreductase RutF
MIPGVLPTATTPSRFFAVAIDSKTFRNIMGSFATGVTVVTTVKGDRYHGMTANSVTSVSLDPMLLLVCVEKGATAHQELRDCDSFGVSILSAEQESVSNTFASSGVPERGTLRGVPFRLGSSGVPLIEGALACLECQVTAELDGGDHTIFLGKVIEAESRDDGAPLLFFGGGYRLLAG